MRQVARHRRCRAGFGRYALAAGPSPALILALALALALIVTPASPAAAQQALIQLPQTPSKCPVRLRILRDTSAWPGYHRFHVEARTANGAPAPRDYALALQIGRTAAYYGNNSGQTVVPTTFTLPKGRAVATTDVLVPQAQRWAAIGIQGTVDGRYAGVLSTMQWVYQASGPNPTLVVDPAVMPREVRDELLLGGLLASKHQRELTLPDVRRLAQLLQENANTNWGVLADPTKATTDVQLLRALAGTQQSFLQLADPGSIEANWLALSAYRRLIIAWPVWRDLVAKEPERARAIEQWTRMGGNLIVWGVTTGDVPALTGTFPFPPEVEADRWRKVSASVSSATIPFDQHVERAVWPETPSTSGWTRAGGMTIEELARLPGDRPAPAANGGRYDGRLLQRKLHFGQIVAVLDEDVYDNEAEEWAAIFGTTEATDPSAWEELWGGSEDAATYWHQLIPSVGGTPVIVFLVLITGFVILIGPVNYGFLRSRRRLAMLLLTVPGGAALMMAGLVAYAVIHDGLHTRTRVHSLTMLDADTREASTLSLQTYYAGLAPAGGLVFPDRAAVYERTPASLPGMDTTNAPTRTVTWEDGRQRWAGQSLPSRSQELYCVGLPQTLAGTLEARPSPGGGGLDVVNTLGTEIVYVVAAGEDGTLYAGEAIPHAGRATLAATPPDQVVERGQALWRAAIPATAAERYNVGSGPLAFWAASARSTGFTSRAVVAEVPERLFRSRARSAPQVSAIPPRRVVAVLRDAPFLPRGLSGTTDEASFHLLITAY